MKLALPIEDDKVFEEVHPVVSGVRSEELLDDSCEGDFRLCLGVLATECTQYS